MSYRPGSEVELARAQQRVFMAGNGATAIGQVPASGGDPLEGVDSISEFNFGEARCGGHVDARSGKTDEYACMIQCKVMGESQAALLGPFVRIRRCLQRSLRLQSGEGARVMLEAGLQHLMSVRLCCRAPQHQ